MTAGNMSKLMGHDALDFDRAVRGLNGSGIEKYPLPASHKGVDLFAVDQDNIDILCVQLRHPDQRGDHVAEQRFGFCITEDGLGEDWLRSYRDHRQKGGYQLPDTEQRKASNRFAHIIIW